MKKQKVCGISGYCSIFLKEEDGKYYITVGDEANSTFCAEWKEISYATYKELSEL